MYNERRSSFAFKDIILKLLLGVLIVFIIVGVFPTKSFVKNLIDSKMGTNENAIFNSNVETMKNAALSYYNGERLPSKSDKITLKEMLDKNLLVSLVDSDGKSCDVKKSSVKVTKNDNDYTMEVNLVCGKKDEKIISYFGSYDYCENGVCEKKKLTDNSESEETTSSSDAVATASECKYSKNTGGYYNYSNWSSWSTTKVSASSSREVETKVDKIKVGTVVEQSGTKKITQNPKKVTGTKNGQKFVVYVCPADFDNGGSYDTARQCVKTVPNYVNKDTYKNVTYYRYRTKTYVSGGESSKWSNCNDTNLINQGYKLTGETR